jgi:16S rRNA C1402 N4-methylase RsmH
VLSLLVPPAGGGLFVDATLGEGGHSLAFLERYPKLSVIGVDADPAILATARERLRPFAERMRFVNSWYSSFFKEYAGEPAPDLVLMDLGISRFHYEATGRGFSFDRDEALDMRLSPDLATTAADVVNTSGAAELADILDNSFNIHEVGSHEKRFCFKLPENLESKLKAWARNDRAFDPQSASAPGLLAVRRDQEFLRQFLNHYLSFGAWELGS